MPKPRPFCASCGEPIIWARSEALKWQALNPRPDPEGNVHAYEYNGNWRARSVPPRTPAHLPDRLMMPHEATCAGAKPQPAPAPKPAGVTSLDEWRKAASRHAKTKRNQRGRRRSGVTVYAPGMNIRRPR